MTLELDSHSYESLMASANSKGRSASICSSGFSAMESAAIAAAASRRQLPPQNFFPNGGRSGFCPQEEQFGSRGSGGNMHINAANNVTPTRSRKHAGAHRSQSARVPGSQRPKIKRREQDLLQDYHQQQLDLASSESALRDCQESYNPFLNGRLVTSTSLEMSQGSLHQHHQSTPPPQHQHQPHNQHPHQQQHQQICLEPPRDSPHLRRRHSGSGYEGGRRGSNDQKPLLEGGDLLLGCPIIIPTLATPQSSPQPLRRGGTNASANNGKPSGLPKSPTTSRGSPASGGSGSQRRVNSMKNPKRREQQERERYHLDVPQNESNTSPEDEDEESYRLRSFSLTPKGGIVNRGDSFRRRRSRSNSLIPTPTTPQDPQGQGNASTCFTTEDGLLMPANIGGGSSRGNSRNNSRRSSRASPNQTPNQSPRPSIAPLPPSPTGPATHYRVAMIGGRGVGKNALISQFLTSDSINAYDEGQDDVEGEKSITVMLNGEESEVTFFKMNNPKTELSRQTSPDGFLLVYSVVDRASFQRVETELRRLQELDLLGTKAVVIVANKIDLARSRSISTQDGRCLAVTYRVKFIEVSVGINHNVDELLVGILNQIRLKIELCGTQDGWCKHRGMLKASAKARQMLSWVLGKEDAKFKNCENLHVL